MRSGISPGVGRVTVTLIQEVLQRAASDSYDEFRAFLTSLRSRVGKRDAATDTAHLDLIVVRSDDGRWELHLPGNLPEAAHVALVRDFDAVVRDAGGATPFRIVWDEDEQKWVRG